MQRLLSSDAAYATDRAACKAKGVQLLYKMKKAEQEDGDFEDPEALWGYTALKFVERCCDLWDEYGRELLADTWRTRFRRAGCVCLGFR